MLLYLSTYAAFGYYHLVGQKTAFVFLAILIAEAAALSLVYNAPAIAIMALIGGLLTPVLLHSDRDQYRSFFYLSRRARRRSACAAQTLARTQLSRLLRHTTTLLDLVRRKLPPSKTRGRSHLSNRDISALPAGPSRTRFAPARGSHARRRAAVVSQSVRLLCHCLSPAQPDTSRLDGRVCDRHGAALRRHREDSAVRVAKSRREILLLIAVALTFVTIAIPIQLRSNWITIAWAVEGVAILWAGLEIQSVRLRAHAFALFALAFFKFLFWDTPYGYRPAFTPVFNRYFLSSLAVIGCFLAAVYLFERAGERKLIDGAVTKLVIALRAAFAFWLLISIETHTYFAGARAG